MKDAIQMYVEVLGILAFTVVVMAGGAATIYGLALALTGKL